MRPHEPISKRWMTPDDLLTYAAGLFGRAEFDFDLCADAGTLQFGPLIPDVFDDADVLARIKPDERQLLWMNPPFGGKHKTCPPGCTKHEPGCCHRYDFPGMQAFLEQFVSLISGRPQLAGCILTEAATGDQWFQEFFARNLHLGLRLELLPRIRHIHPETGAPGMQPKSGHALWIFRDCWEGSTITFSSYKRRA